MSTPQEPKILEYCRASVAALRAHYERSKVVGHHGLAGTARENLIHDFLREHLPPMADIAGGQLVDAENRVSKQQDLVLVLRSAPRFRFSSNVEIIPIEAVLGAMEIKSTLKKKEVEFAVSNFESVKALTVSVVSFGQMGVTHTWPATRTLTLLVAYDSGGGLERVHQWLDEIGGDGLPDVVLVLSEGLLVKNHGLLFPKQQEPATYLRVAEPGQGLMWVLMFLTEIAGTVMSRGVQWRRYCT